jgi:TonB family protein
LENIEIIKSYKMFKKLACLFSLLLINSYSFAQQPKSGMAGGINNSYIFERYSVASKTSNVRNGPSEKWYQGVKIISCEYVDGKKNGLWKSQSVDGHIFFQGNYLNDKKNGAWKYYLNQKRLCVVYFKEEKKDSTWQSFFPDGKTQCIKTYSNDIQVGPMKLYFENGNLKSEMTFVDDYMDGKCSSYYPNGTLQSVIEYKYGIPYNVLKMNDSLGNPLNFGTLKNGTGKFIEYSITGKKRYLTTYEKGYKNGVSLTFFENGQTYSEDEYAMGKKDGTSTIYFSNGELYYSAIYMEGNMIKNNYDVSNDNPLIEKDQKEISSFYEQAEISPEFLGGEKGLMNFIQSNFEYPAVSKTYGQQGTSYTSFIIDISGKINDIKVIKGVTYELDAEAINVVKKMPPWIPGFKNGLPVPVEFNLPIKFTVKR